MLLNYCDPFYLLLRFIVLRRFLSSELLREEIAFVHDNIHKHRQVLWMCSVAVSFVIWGLIPVPPNIGTLVGSLVGPVFVFGGAWFSISFGGVPQKLLAVAMSTTMWMFTAFMTSLMTMFIVVAFVSPPQIWPMLVIVFWSGYVSCVQYDTADGLKAGLDEAVLKHSRAALLFYKNVHQIDDGEHQ